MSARRRPRARRRAPATATSGAIAAVAVVSLLAVGGCRGEDAGPSAAPPSGTALAGTGERPFPGATGDGGNGGNGPDDTTARPPGTRPIRPLPDGPRVAVTMPQSLVDQRREWWLGEQLALTDGPDGSLALFFTTLLDPSTDDTQLSFTRWDSVSGAWTAPVEVLRGPQVRPLGGLSIAAATDPRRGRIGVVWERQTATGASTGAELAWTDDDGANWEHHTVDRPASLPRLALRAGKAYVAFRDLTGMVLASSATPAKDDGWSITPIPDNASRRATATPSVLTFDANDRPVLTYQTVATDEPTRWLTTWWANPPDGAANPTDVAVTSEDDALRRLLDAERHVDRSGWETATLTVPGTACPVQVDLTAAGTPLVNCPLGTAGTDVGPIAVLRVLVGDAATAPLAPAVATTTGEGTAPVAIAATVYSLRDRPATATDPAPGIYVWHGRLGDQWRPPAAP